LPVTSLCALVEMAEATGFDGVGVADHVCVPVRLDSQYPYTGRRGLVPAGAEFPDPLVLIAGLSARVTRLRFMTLVLLASLRHPILLANQVATAASLTESRLDLGVGVGWMREEFEALKVSYACRGSRTDEMLALLRELWSGEPVEHNGQHFAFERLEVRPVPPEPVPIFVGGVSHSALRRAAQFGDGWVGVNPTFEELAEIVNGLQVECHALDRAPGDLQIRTGLKGQLTEDAISAAAELGVDGIVVLPWQLPPRGVSIDEMPHDELARRLRGLAELIRSAESTVAAVGRAEP
jgi:probable F420-dependent oxidoreductase